MQNWRNDAAKRHRHQKFSPLRGANRMLMPKSNCLAVDSVFEGLECCYEHRYAEPEPLEPMNIVRN